MSRKRVGATTLCALVLSAVTTACTGQNPTQPTGFVQPTAFNVTAQTGSPGTVTAASTLSANGGTVHAVIRQDFTLSSPCFGEPVHITGEVYEVIEMQQTGNGLLTMVHHNPAGVTGVGLLSGATYHGTGVGQGVTFGDEDFTFVLSFNNIGEGSAGNFLLHQTIHMTTTANGDVTANVSNVSMDCH
jgi:hypothetical protein